MAITRSLTLLLCYLSTVYCVLVLPKEDILWNRGKRLEKLNSHSNIFEIPSSFSRKLLKEHQNAISKTQYVHHDVQRRDASCALDNRELESDGVCLVCIGINVL